MNDREEIIIEENQVSVLDAGKHRINSDGSATYRLVFPKTIRMKTNNAEKIEELDEIIIKRPCGSDLRKINKIKDQLEAGVEAFFLLTGHPHAVFDKLDGIDIKNIGEIVGQFTGESQ
ncbi:MAG: hypothetical protein DI551_08190 [Micavibrio aeruginosavorus]|uniref:Phage tail assembly protein n=1 Tax=Micavibrio aeruginosavorus TaxID=349221 RepID=A0A2W5PKN9_9BACT|nr:MAG: hypothetical protein DI551_08190 [Micavibrio aeruginosavorus]